jgi:hypothetical protein
MSILHYLCDSVAGLRGLCNNVEWPQGHRQKKLGAGPEKKWGSQPAGWHRRTVRGVLARAVFMDTIDGIIDSGNKQMPAVLPSQRRTVALWLRLNLSSGRMCQCLTF